MNKSGIFLRIEINGAYKDKIYYKINHEGRAKTIYIWREWI